MNITTTCSCIIAFHMITSLSPCTYSVYVYESIEYVIFMKHLWIQLHFSAWKLHVLHFISQH